MGASISPCPTVIEQEIGQDRDENGDDPGDKIASSDAQISEEDFGKKCEDPLIDHHPTQSDETELDETNHLVGLESGDEFQHFPSGSEVLALVPGYFVLATLPSIWVSG